MSLLLHWVIALAVLAQVLLITAHEATEGVQAREFVNLHKSLGLTILVLTLARIGWRMAHPALPLPVGLPRWQRWAARAVHILFYVVLLAMPLTGWLASSASGREIIWFGLFDWPLLPISGGRPGAGQLMDVHEAVMKLLYVLIAVHVLAALKHQFVNRDNVLRRMIPIIPRRP